MALGRLKVIQKHLGLMHEVKFEKCSFSEVTRNQYAINLKYTLNNETLSTEQRLFYEENGYLLVPSLFDDDLLDACSLRFIDLCEGIVPKGNITMMKDISLMKTGAKGQYLYNKAQEISYDDVFEKYIFSEKLLNVVECFTGPNIKAVHSMLINKPPDSGELTSRHPMHQDLHYFPFRPANKIVAAWTALEDVTVDNGCLIVIPGSHTGPLLQHDYPEWEGGVNKAFHGVRDYDHDKVIPLCMKKGETVFFHPHLIHGSGPNNTNGFRKAISCHYAASECYYIDVKGTFQENIAREVEEIAEKKGYGSRVTFQDVWRMKSRLVRGIEITL